MTGLGTTETKTNVQERILIAAEEGFFRLRLCGNAYK
jgi:hypothetical protein